MREALRHYRKENGLTQALIAEKLGVTQPVYSNLENGTRAITKDIEEKMNKLGIKTDINIYDKIEQLDYIDRELLGVIVDRMLL